MTSDEMVDAYNKGATIEEIALDAEISTYMARKLLLEAGVTMRPPGKRSGMSSRDRYARPGPRASEPKIHHAYGGARAAHRRRGGG